MEMSLDERQAVLRRALAFFRRHAAGEPASIDELREVLLEVLRCFEVTDDQLATLVDGVFDDDELAEIRQRLGKRVEH